MPSLVRRIAALLAALALLAVPARSAVACEMSAVPSEAGPGAAHQVEPEAHAGPAVGHHAHAPGGESPAGAQQGPCDHLMGCAPAALTDAGIRLPEGATTSARLVPFASRPAESPARALEPPPPRR